MHSFLRDFIKSEQRKASDQIPLEGDDGPDAAAIEGR
jgi:hypothetical protein